MAQLQNLTINDTGSIILPTQASTARGIRIFDRNGTYSFTVPTGITSLEVLVVGGGGGGGQTIGGGGGAGGVIYNNAYAVTGGQTLTITVGAGGAGAPGNTSSGASPGYGTGGGAQGSNSSITGGAGGTLTAIGGGGGGNYNQTSFGATSGGSGGGGGAASSGNAAGTSGQGNQGGNASANSNDGAGGGGAGGQGGNSSSGTPGVGGVGVQYSVSGDPRVYAGGGGGGSRRPNGGGGGLGGSSIGGKGGFSLVNGSPGLDGTGSGGGGGGWDDSVSPQSAGGGNGGTGVVIIRWGGTTTNALASGMMQLNSTSKSLEVFHAGTWKSVNLTKQPIPRDKLVFYYDFSDPTCYPGSGSTVYDLSGNNYHGTLLNSPTYTGSENSAGDFAFQFNGSNQRIQNSYKPTGERSWFFWVKYNSITGLTGGYSLQGLQEGAAYTYIGIQNGGQGYFYAANGSDGGNYDAYYKVNQWYHVGLTINASGVARIYHNGRLHETRTQSGIGNTATNTFELGSINNNHHLNGWLAAATFHSKALNSVEVARLFNADAHRFGLAKVQEGALPDGTFGKPFGSPIQAQGLGYAAGNYYFRSGNMTTPRLMEYVPFYYENRPWCCVFRSAYRKTATTNYLDLSIPMAGLLVQKDTQNVRAAVYWSTPITYNSVGGSGDNTADSGYSPRRVILGSGGGHGIFRTDQTQCGWGNSSGAVGAGWDGSTCGSFPNDLIWGIGDTGGSATYNNRNGTWSHWIYWEGDNYFTGL